MKKRALSLAALFMALSYSDAKVTLPSVISDNMVLQQNTQAAIWGTAEPGKKVTITTGWAKDKTVVTADKSGKWIARVATPVASADAPAYDITISDGEAVTLHNVLIGDVWFCSGQSNMEMPVKGYGSQPAKGGVDYIIRAKADRPLRMCNIQRKSSVEVQQESVGSWTEHTPQAVADISATAYFFAEYVQSVVNIPIGILVTCWGGSSIETWIPRNVIEKEFPEFNLDYLDGKSEVNQYDNYRPCLLFNGQVNPVVPYTFKGMLWYQGETNRGRQDQYIRLQEAYVRTMRDIFNVPDAPFYFVQIAPYSYGRPDDWTSGYFCEAQEKSLAVIPNSGMATTCDTGEKECIHPAAKETVGHRLAYLALMNDYGMSAIAAKAPTYKSVEFEGNVAHVSFNVDGLGLCPLGAQIQGFEIAGADKMFYPASAWLRGGSVIDVTSPEVPEPVAVRYCFRNWCIGGLYNNFGVPAGPFRTDDWQL